MRAYLLVKFKTDADLSQAQHALGEAGVSSVDLVMGPYDAVVNIEVDDFAALAALAKRVRNCPGIRDSVTCPVAQA